MEAQLPLLKRRLARRATKKKNDIVLLYMSVSSQHCRLDLEEGYWFARDLRSRNGTQVDGVKLPIDGVRKRLPPNAVLGIAKHQYVIRYDPQEAGGPKVGHLLRDETDPRGSP